MPESSSLRWKDAGVTEMVPPLQRLRKVLLISTYFLADPLMLGCSCNSKCARTRSIGILVVELFAFSYCGGIEVGVALVRRAIDGKSA